MTSHMNWRRNKNYVVEHFLPAAVLWHEARKKGTTHAELAKGLGKSAYTVQSTLAGKCNLTWDRAFWLATLLDMTRMDLVRGCDELQDKLARELDNLHLYKEFPTTPPQQGERLVMAYNIQDRLLGLGWEEIFEEGVTITSDAVWRARLLRGWGRTRAAKEFGVTVNTIAHWEKAHFPSRRWEQAEVIYGRYLQ